MKLNGSGRSEIVRELRRSQQARGPRDAAVARLAERLAHAGVFGSKASAPIRRKLGFTNLVPVVIVAGGLFIASKATDSSPPARPIAPAPSRVEQASVPITSDLDASEVVEVPVVSVEDLPTIAPRPRTPAPLARAVTGEKEPASELVVKNGATELELVRRAGAVLSTDPSQSLALVAESARAYPNGEFVQEREVIAVEALVRLGQIDESIRRARALLLRFPHTPYTARLELAIGQPLSSTAGTIDAGHAGSEPSGW